MIKTHVSRGFTLIELLVVISIIALLISILLPALGAARQAAQQMQNSTQLRGIHQGMYIFSQENKGFFPGFDNEGQPFDDDEGPANPNDAGSSFRVDDRGTTPLRRLAIMLDAELFPTEYMISPGDTNRVLPEPVDPSDANGDNLDSENYSYSMLQISFHDPGNNGAGRAWRSGETYIPSDRGQEWQDTTNSSAIMLSDRAISDDGMPGNVTRNVIDYHSVWTRQDSANWAGSVLRNDGSVQFGSSPDGFTTQYGNGPTITEDNLFLRGEGGPAQGRPAESNAVLVFGNANATAAN